MRRGVLIVLAIMLSQILMAQSETKEYPGIVFGRIYTGFYYSFNDQIEPQKGFDFTTGILGYTRQLNENIKATLLYDVTRTTNFSGLDTLGFEGSKYTAFLKMAQIDWEFQPKFKLSVGQLLNEQYLTVQDKWWGFRYVDVTMQEKFKFGMPADFGARLTYSPLKSIQLSYSVVNGEGPFRHQDADGLFLHSFNVEYRPIKNLLIKTYVASETAPEGDELDNKEIISVFIGYISEALMSGFEANYVNNYGFEKEKRLRGISIYGSKTIAQKLKALARLDYFDPGLLQGAEYNYYLLAGVEFQPGRNFGCALTYRVNTYQIQGVALPQLNVNFGIKF